MEEEQKIKQDAPWDRINFVEKIFFTWVFPVFWKGLKKDCLDFEDLYRCPKNDESHFVVKQLEKNWKIERQKKNKKFWKALFRTFSKHYIFPLIILLFQDCFLSIAQPLLLGRVIKFFSNSGESYFNACLAAGGVCLCSIVFITLNHLAFLLVAKMGMRLRIACCTIMYKKSLKLSHASLGKTTVGQIVNLMSNDVNRFDEFSVYLSYFIIAPLQTSIIIYIIWGYLGPSCLVGVALLLLFIPFQALMGILFSKVRLSTAQLTDSRLQLMSEIISGMRVIKMYTWERPFALLVSEARKLEVESIRRACFLKAINLSIFFVFPRMILFFCFVTFVLTGHTLNAEAVFVTMALFNALRITMTWLFPQSVSFGAELMISCKRIQTFLELEETEQKSLEYSEKQKSSVEVIVNNITVKWNDEMEFPTLRNISLKDIKPGHLVAVVGSVGSGKSSFLMTILGELPLTSGNIKTEGRIAYASQEPWSFNASVRNNILFGNAYDEKKYKQVIDVCALERDLTLFPFGDRTLVGERGVSLSGGQKARITLARALYRDADIYLLDDPLSAVDSAVAKHIFEKCIVNHLKDKIRILVTHQIQFLRKATQILVLNEGKCMALGTFEELQKSSIDFMTLLNENKERESLETIRSRAKTELMVPNFVNEAKPRTKSELLTVSEDESRGRLKSLSIGSVESFKMPEISIEEKLDLTNPKIQEEKREIGSIQGTVYWQYIKAGAGPILMTLTVLSTLISQCIFHGSDLWLTAWTDKNQREQNEQIDQTNNVIVYSALIAGLFVISLLRSTTFFTMCMRSSVNLHNSIFYRLLRAPMSVFDNNPVGRILNRFTKDLGIVDEQLPSTTFDLNLALSQAIGIVIVVGIVNYYLIIPAVVLTILTVKVRGIYIKSARDIKTIRGFDPLYSHVSTTLNGLASVRAFGAQSVFESQYYRYQNDHSATWFLFVCSSRTLGLVMDCICVGFIVTIALVLMIFPDGVAGGTAGLVFSSALLLFGLTQLGVRQSAELESQMTAVERIIEYSKLEQEAGLKSSADNKPDKEWPKKGEIKIVNMSIFYDNAPKPVLKNICCLIRGGEKIGIVGRTGAGKSSLLAALFRMVEPKGSIIIDGIDTKLIGLHDLRNKISIIPQDPVVFTGPVRRNIDPFGQFPDEKLWEVLTEVQLKNAVNDLPGKLDSKLTEGGCNFSVGQRQLICLARAILRRNKILVLDEATANVDHHTDALIQTTIRTKFIDCTVLTIAHRLNTIIDCDRVLVLDAGEIVEFDEPYTLLKQKGSFYQMIKKTGKEMFSHLVNSVKVTHLNKHNIDDKEENKEIEFEEKGNLEEINLNHSRL